MTETDRAKNRAGVPDYGVYGADDFKVKPHPSIPYAVIVTKGKAHGWGVTDEATEDQVVQCGTISSGTRYDLIADRRNWQPAAGGPSTLVAIPGSDVAEIPATRKVGPGVEDDQPLALVKWKAGLSAPEKIIDLRCWAGNGGVVAKEDLVRTYLTRIGTRLRIGSAEWQYTIGPNDIPVWIQTNLVPRAEFVSQNMDYPGDSQAWGPGTSLKLDEASSTPNPPFQAIQDGVKVMESGAYFFEAWLQGATGSPPDMTLALITANGGIVETSVKQGRAWSAYIVGSAYVSAGSDVRVSTSWRTSAWRAKCRMKITKAGLA
ncbi:hypothetical protein [Arthrobacter sp. FW306-2-2C-D06B]|uniref:hypothetical protein n=1 Tax=Arthrobacter sp. FW306-2-2C-D06B TaxID=2879618 RepID=UPI001F2103FD|nr:hypothetical protein [Arthrobacter sp. FW306-2-2C-D06B]UKA59150.1 hypothetical protein LFT47_02000 [Arthrobacter sp. FW306-2-2C-D06B]